MSQPMQLSTAEAGLCSVAPWQVTDGPSTEAFGLHRAGARDVSATAVPGLAIIPHLYIDRDVLYADFQPLVRRLIRQYGGDDFELRQDLAGEIYFRFCSLLDAFDPGRGVPLRPYLVRQLTASIYTYARQQWRARKREVSLDLDVAEAIGGSAPAGGAGSHVSTDQGGLARSSGVAGAAFGSAVDPTPSWDDALMEQQVLHALPHLIAKLPTRQRQVLIWRYYDQRPFEEIAAELQVKEATARSLLRHALNNVRRGISGMGLD